MTPKEINVAYRKQLLVTIKESMSHPDLHGGIYKICKFGNWYDEKTKSFQYYVTLKAPEGGRTTYEIPAHLIKPLPGFEGVIQNFIKEKSLEAEG